MWLTVVDGSGLHGQAVDHADLGRPVGDPGPGRGPAGGQVDVPVRRGVVPGRHHVQVLRLARVVEPGHDDGLVGQGVHPGRAEDQVDLPELALGAGRAAGVAGVADLEGPERVDELEGRVGSRLLLELGIEGHVVLDAEHLQVLDAEGHVGPAGIGDPDHGVGRLEGQLRLVDEMERRRGRGLVVEALHRADAPVGPVRQHGEGVRGAVVVHLRLVLPHEVCRSRRSWRCFSSAVTMSSYSGQRVLAHDAASPGSVARDVHPAW